MKAFAVYGPPGTGKTTEMLGRIEAISKKYAPAGVYFMSFTKAAAQEALGRVGLSRSDNFSTIHSLCYRLTRVNHASVVDLRKLKQLSELTGVRITGGRGDDDDGLSDGDLYLQTINRADNSLISLEEAYEMSGSPGVFDEFIMFSNSYNEWKKAYGYIDFNDMLRRVLGNGIKFGATHLVIDEAQDLSPLQWAVINRLIELSNPKEVHISGDDDQCLYAWSGANPSGMSEFEDSYSASRTVLSQSWRIPRSVHGVAHGVINRVSRRVDKEYKSKSEEGEIAWYVDSHGLDITHGEDTMILGRTHSALIAVENRLKEQCIPYEKTGGVSLFNNRFAHSIRACIRLARGNYRLKDVEYNSLLKTLSSPVDRGMVESGDYSTIASERWYNLLNIPYSLMSYYENVDIEAEPTIRVSTIHASKGKEADRVILLTSLTNRITEAMTTTRGADDEHRCMYVGVTRAKSKLDIISDDEGYQI